MFGIGLWQKLINLAKIFVLRLFKAVANPTECSVIKFLGAEKYKPFEIYRRMSYVHGEACFRLKNVYKSAKYGFATRSLC